MYYLYDNADSVGAACAQDVRSGGVCARAAALLLASRAPRGSIS